MKVTAVIAEYNPFHNGHLYQLDTIRQTLGTDIIIVVMSGDFTQRGIPAIVDKYERCRMALEHGADLVFELPVYFALGSAEYFAQGAVSLIDKLGVVDYLHFGSESGDISLMYEFTSMMLAHESNAYKTALNQYLKQGFSFPAARDNALSELLPDQKVRQLVSAPNNILGMEYIKALIQRNSTVKPITIARKGAGYASDSLMTDGFASANAIRKALFQQSDAGNPAAQDTDLNQLCIKDHVPAPVDTLLNRKKLIFANDFSEILLYKMQNEVFQYKTFHNKMSHDKISHNKMSHDKMSYDKIPYDKLSQAANLKDTFAKYYDIGEQLSHTLYNNLPGYTALETFALLCKTKNLTYTHICRGLMHILLEMTQENADALKHNDYAQYARLLGFTEHGKQLLGSIKANASIPVITKPSSALRQLSDTALMSLQSDIHAADIYDSVRQQKQIRLSDTTTGIVRHNELTCQIIKL